MKLLLLFLLLISTFSIKFKELSSKFDSRLQSKAGDEEEENIYGEGFVYYYDMPADDKGLCNLDDVSWNRPFLNLFLKDSTGQASDMIVLENVGTKNLFDLFEENEKKKEELQAKKKKFPKPKQEEEKEKIVQEFTSIPFWKITKFLQVSSEKGGKGVCFNYKQFIEDLSGMDPSQNPSDKISPVEFSLKHCIIIQHETKTGRALICHSKNPKMASDIIEFLNNEIESITDNCEFLARHMRIQRDKFPNRVKALKASMGDSHL